MIDFFQTLNVQRFIFADGDNANNPKAFIDFLNEHKYLNLETQIICMIGANANQNTWYTNAVKYIQSLDKKTSFNLTPIRIVTEGENALDMVLCSYIGLAMGQNPRAEFLIVSNDNDYKSVIEHFSSLGLKIERKSIENEKTKTTDIKQQKQETVSKETVDKLVKRVLKPKPSRRPQKIGALKNLLQNNVSKIANTGNLEDYYTEVLEELKRRKLITLKEQKILWSQQNNVQKK